MPRNDQPALTINYNTDQFTDPIFGYTVHDDGTSTYTQPDTGIIYRKLRAYNGISASGYCSYKITLISTGLVSVQLTDDTSQFNLTADDGVTLLLSD